MFEPGSFSYLALLIVGLLLSAMAALLLVWELLALLVERILRLFNRRHHD